MGSLSLVKAISVTLGLKSHFTTVIMINRTVLVYKAQNAAHVTSRLFKQSRQTVSIYTLYFLKKTVTRALCHEHTGSSHCLDLLLGPSAKELGLDDHRLLGQLAFAQDFVVAL